MIEYLEKQLYKKSKDSQSRILYSKWNYDKTVIPQALQTISNFFPHYSLHDESHSITVVNNIVRIIGKKNIKKLSAIDIWLILEAAYSHDIGMVIPSDILTAEIKSEDFIYHLKEIQDNKQHTLWESANLFKIEENIIKFKNDYFDLITHEAIKYLIADYFRKFHANRSKEIIIDPEKMLSLASPLGIIPKRIIDTLSEICACHTKEFPKVMDLPFREVGIDNENMHPRFIACLLRIGDLLDLDNPRFSEVQLRTLSKIPLDAIFHKGKHSSIVNFRADKKKIKILAKCEDYDIANITQYWFNLLDSEISNQMKRWNDIIPNKKFDTLPTVGDLKVKLNDYETIDSKKKPQFSIETDKAIELLQGAGLYDGAYQSMREILQNSVDASLIKMWLEYQGKKDFTTPQSKDFISLLINYPISINIQPKGVRDGFQTWNIVIEDSGIGISIKDLSFLAKTGGSSRNCERGKIIEKMPYWMRPSGTFGIGFQSIFMLTDVVNIRTKSFSDEQLLEIELNSPNSSKNGDILIKRKISNHSIKPFTRIDIDYITKAIPDRYSIPWEFRNANQIVDNYDPFTNESMDIELGKILDEIIQFSTKGYFPVKLAFKNEIRDLSSECDIKFSFFDSKNVIEMDIFAHKNNRYDVETYYKNQFVHNNFSFPFLGFKVNIHKEKASEALTLNRNKIKGEFQNKLKNLIIDSSFDIITKNFDNIFKDKEEKEIGSMYLHYHSNKELLEKYDISTFNYWQNFAIQTEDGKEFEIIDLLKDSSSVTIKYVESTPPSYMDIFEYKSKKLIISIRGGHPSYDYTRFFLMKIPEYYQHFYIKENTALNIEEIIFSKTKDIAFFIDYVKIVTRHKNKYPSSARAFIPCIDKFKELKVRKDANLPYAYKYTISHNFQLPINFMLSPFVRETNLGIVQMKEVCNDELINWVYENRYDEKTSKEDIEQAYRRFIDSIKLDEINKAYSNEEATIIIPD
jgi:hypothetical protein